MKENTTHFRKASVAILFTMMVLASAFVMPSLAAESGEINYQITVGDYEITEDDEGFHRITMSTQGYGVMDSPGDPALPERLFEFAVPDNIDWSTVEYTAEIIESEVLPGLYNVTPIPALVYDSREYWGEEKAIVDGRNMYVYGKDAYFPAESIEVLPYTERKEPVGNGFENMQYLRCMYNPFLYNPVDQHLTLIKTVDLHITYDLLPTRPMTPIDGDSYDYIIVTTNLIESNSERLEHFVHLKEIYGHTVKVITEDDYGGYTGQPPNGIAEKIRACLVDYESTYGIDYALLIGNPDPDDPLDAGDSVGDVPMKMCMPRYFSTGDRNCPTDYFYADLSGNWDLDGDGYFCENLDSTHPISPDPSINSDYFSVRWTGYVLCDFDEEYQFHTFSDGGIKVYLDGDPTPIINNWDDFTEHPPTNDYGTKTMTAGWHPITVEYKEHTGDGIAQLFWKTTVDKDHPHYVGHNIIPLDHLLNETGTNNGLTGRYYNNIYFTEPPDLIHPDGEVINFIWGTGDQGSGGPDPGADVYVGRIPMYNNNYSQLDAILGKIIDYETDYGDISWRYTLLLPMQPLWDDTPAWHLGEGIMNDYALAAGFTCFRIYEEDYAPSGPTPELYPCNYTNCVNEWRNGYGMVTYDTHGDSDDAMDIITSADCPTLDDSKPCFTYQTACNNGYPESSNNLGYALLKHGGIATMAATRVTYGQHGEWWTFDPTSSINHHMAYFYTKKVIDDTVSKPAGVAAYLTKGDIPTIDHNSMNYNLYGDPECYLKTTIPNYPPVADAGTSYSEDEGTAIVFDASGSYDPEGDTLEYRWDVDNDGNWDSSWSTSPTFSYSWCDDHTGTAKVEVRDQLGKTDDDTASVVVSNVAPDVNAGVDQTVDEGDIVSFSGSFTDPGCDTWTYEWEFGDGHSAMGTLTPTHAYGDNGVYAVNLTVTDDDGGTDTDTLHVTVSNVPPLITDLTMDQPNPQFILPVVHNLNYTGNFTDPGWLDTHTALWEWGDSTSDPGDITEENNPPDATGTAVGQHVYMAPGVYDITLTITDDDGGTDDETMNITVVDEFGALRIFDEYIQNLSDTVFKGNPVQRKKAFHNMLSAIYDMLVDQEYNGAIQHLRKNVREKSDGLIDGDPKGDWIIDYETQYHICMKVDDLTAYLEYLLASLP